VLVPPIALAQMCLVRRSSQTVPVREPDGGDEFEPITAHADNRIGIPSRRRRSLPLLLVAALALTGFGIGGYILGFGDAASACGD
jgi:hypothetical protein